MVSISCPCSTMFMFKILFTYFTLPFFSTFSLRIRNIFYAYYISSIFYPHIFCSPFLSLAQCWNAGFDIAIYFNFTDRCFIHIINFVKVYDLVLSRLVFFWKEDRSRFKLVHIHNYTMFFSRTTTTTTKFNPPARYNKNSDVANELKRKM